MLETWIQYTCDGCGETEFAPNPDATRKEVREYIQGYGWKHYGSLDYCRRCVANGNAKNRRKDMGG